MPEVVYGDERDLAVKLNEMASRLRMLEARRQKPSADLSIPAHSFSATVGDDLLREFTVAHGLGTRDVVVSVRRAEDPWDEIDGTTNSAPSDNEVIVTFPDPPFSVPPAVNEYRVTVIA